MKSFSDLLKIHEKLDEDFRQHQYALLHFEFERAAKLLLAYRDRLLEHMSFEEEVLLPIYDQKATIAPAGETTLFLKEHEKMRDWIALFIDTIKKLQSEDPPEPVLLNLLDRENFYLKLCSHHDNREATFLYPGLDAVTSLEERVELLADAA